ncbi:hypothetical protein JXA40_02035 [bacterium]|nr:hypothetical protein [candidate division CSSED10-310 bacterium]
MKRPVSICLPIILPGSLFFIFLAGMFEPSGDMKWVIPVARSLIQRGDLNIDEYIAEGEQIDFSVEPVRGQYYSIFPYGVSLIAVPFVFIVDRMVSSVESVRIGSGLRVVSDKGIERIAASFLMAVAALLVYWTALRRTTTIKAVVISLIFSFCTPVWSTATRALWQHGPSILLLSATLALLAYDVKNPRLVPWSGMTVAASFLMRPTNGISLAIITAFVFIRHPRKSGWFLLCLISVIGPFCIANLVIYRCILPPYYMPGRVGTFVQFPEALMGNLFSPARGLFVFSPVFLFVLPGIALLLRRGKFQMLHGCLLAIIMLHWLVISTFRHWYGGWCFGPRFFSDMVPYLVFFLIPCLDCSFSRFKNKLMYLVFWFSVMVSLFIHARGSLFWDANLWNARPVNVDQDPGRIWDWGDLQFLRGLVEPPR